MIARAMAYVIQPCAQYFAGGGRIERGTEFFAAQTLLPQLLFGRVGGKGFVHEVNRNIEAAFDPSCEAAGQPCYFVPAVFGGLWGADNKLCRLPFLNQRGDGGEPC